MYIDNRDLQETLQLYYDTGLDIHYEAFFELAYKIALLITEADQHLSKNDAYLDVASNSMISIIKKVQAKAIDPSSNIHSYLVGNVNWRIDDYKRSKFKKDETEAGKVEYLKDRLRYSSDFEAIQAKH